MSQLVATRIGQARERIRICSPVITSSPILGTLAEVLDYMHAKIVVCDDWVMAGSYNCSHSGELNAENILDIRDAELADRCAAYCEQVHARYASSVPPVGSP